MLVAVHDQLQTEIRKLVDGVYAVRDEQTYLVLREYRHRASKSL